MGVIQVDVLRSSSGKHNDEGGANLHATPWRKGMPF
jgi:hypothetical protein